MLIGLLIILKYFENRANNFKEELFSERPHHISDPSKQSETKSVLTACIIQIIASYTMKISC